MSKPRIQNIIKFTITLVCVGIIIRYFLQHTEELEILKNIRPVDIMKLAIITFFINIIYSVKLFLILKSLNLNSIKYLDWLNIFVTSRFLNLHLPQGGLVYRSHALKKNYKFSYTKTLSLNTFFTWFETTTVLIMSILLLLFLQQDKNGPFINVIMFLSLLAVVFSIMPFLSKWIFSSISFKNKTLSWIIGKFNEIASDVTANIQKKGLILKIQGLNILTFLLQLYWILICFDALSLPSSLSTCVLFLSVIHISGIIMILPGNLGILELITGYLAHIIGWSLGAGILISVIRRITVYLSFAIFGVLLFILKITRPHKKD